MKQRKAASTSPQATVILGLLVLLLVLAIIWFPDKAFQSSLQGLNVWWKLVFPALLPFFILTEIMTGMGVIHGIGKLLEPLMRRLLGLPGAGGWPLAVGLIAGFPAGAAAAKTLNNEGLLQAHEADRLVSLSHLCSPVFLTAVVGTGFFQNPRIGLLLASIHYASAIFLAAIVSRTGRKQEMAANASQTGWLEHPDRNAGLFAKAAFALKEAQRQDGRTFGKLLGDAVVAAVQNVMVIGGYMMMFSVLLNVIGLSGMIKWISNTAGAIGLPSQSVYEWLTVLIPALTEIHLGAYSISQSDMASQMWQAAILSAGLAWGGFSAHLQVKSLTIGTGFRFARFVAYRGVHAALAFVTTLILWHPLNRWLADVKPSFFQHAGNSSDYNVLKSGIWFLISPMMLQFGVILLFLLILSIGVSFIWRGRQ